LPVSDKCSTKSVGSSNGNFRAAKPGGGDNILPQRMVMRKKNSINKVFAYRRKFKEEGRVGGWGDRVQSGGGGKKKKEKGKGPKGGLRGSLTPCDGKNKRDRQSKKGTQ